MTFQDARNFVDEIYVTFDKSAVESEIVNTAEWDEYAVLIIDHAGFWGSGVKAEGFAHDKFVCVTLEDVELMRTAIQDSVDQ